MWCVTLFKVLAIPGNSESFSFVGLIDKILRSSAYVMFGLVELEYRYQFRIELAWSGGAGGGGEPLFFSAYFI